MTRKRILIVDDEIGCTRLLAANLELTGHYEVRVQNRPENTLQIARQFKPHLVLLDLVMPTMSGPQVAKAFRSDSELGSVPIVLLTAADDRRLSMTTDPIVAALPRITKPACMEEILRVIESNLSPIPLPDLFVSGEAVQTFEATL